MSGRNDSGANGKLGETTRGRNDSERKGKWAERLGGERETCIEYTCEGSFLVQYTLHTLDISYLSDRFERGIHFSFQHMS